LKSDFSKLKRKMILWVLLTAVLSLIVLWLLMKLLVDGILQDPFADGFLYLCRKLLGMGREEAILLYQRLFRNNKTLWVFLGYFIIMLIVFYQVLARFTRYFKQVNSGLDRLLEEAEQEIHLSPEMNYMERKLNQIKSSLRKKTQDALEAEQRKNDLVMYLAHDIRTPLTSVIGYLSLLDEAPDLPADQRSKYIRITLEKSYRLEKLINEFFDITRYNLQTMLLEKQTINLPYMLMQMADEFYPTLSQSGKQVLVDAEENLTFYGDPDKLARVFQNILKNAIAYSFNNSIIKIQARYSGNQILISFENQGNQIPEHRLSAIFDKFYRLDEARSTTTGGSGLGLAIAKSIINAHGGEITAESDAAKTVFTITLPRNK
jgi:two-component system sensor histidine kinase VanS